MNLDELFERARNEAIARGDSYLVLTITSDLDGGYWDSAEFRSFKKPYKYIELDSRELIPDSSHWIGGGGEAAGALQCCLDEYAGIVPEIEVIHDANS